jgi:GNAT superfamily N-acetyltransferase
MAWITRRHGEIYEANQGWDRSFETLVGQICEDFERNFDPALEHCWIAEMNGQPVGSIALARSGEEGVAKLRLLLVEEQARGYGLGSRLVDECHRFARAAGYRKMRCGPPTSRRKRATSTRTRAMCWWRKNRCMPSARTWSTKPGNFDL